MAIVVRLDVMMAKRKMRGLELADGLLARGLRVQVAGPDPAPAWHPLRAPYLRADLAAPLPAADVCIGTFWTTLAPAVASGSRHVLHLCQGFEGVHREYAPLLPEIDAAYRLPLAKLVVSPHLAELIERRHGGRCHLIGSGVDLLVAAISAGAVHGAPLEFGSSASAFSLFRPESGAAAGTTAPPSTPAASRVPVVSL